MTIDCINPQLYNTLSKQIGLGYDSKKGQEVVNAVHKSLVDGLGVDDWEITPHASLSGSLKSEESLGAESIDGLDIRFRIEKSLRLKNETESLGQLIKKTQTGSDKTDYIEEGKTVLELAIDAYNLYVRE